MIKAGCKHVNKCKNNQEQRNYMCGNIKNKNAFP